MRWQWTSAVSPSFGTSGWTSSGWNMTGVAAVTPFVQTKAFVSYLGEINAGQAEQPYTSFQTVKGLGLSAYLPGVALDGKNVRVAVTALDGGVHTLLTTINR